MIPHADGVLADRAVGCVAGSMPGGFLRASWRRRREAVRVQERVLLAKIARNAASAFGRDHHFDRIHSLRDFKRELPILSYAEHAPYIERVKAGETSAMFGGGQRGRCSR